MTERTITPDDFAIGDTRIDAAAKSAARSGHRAAVALAVIVTCQLMLILDGTIVNIALPNIQRGLHFSPTGLSWVLNAYTLAFGGLLLLGGRAGDILGRRRLFVAGVALFTVASLVGGFATSAGWLLATRAAQGVAAAMAGPSALALITSNFPEGPARTRALGLFSAASATGASIGLIAGGMLTSWVSWRWVLFVNVPIGIAIALLAPLYLVESERQPGRFDLAGAFTSTGGMVSLVYGFIRAASDGWSDTVTLASFAVAIILLASFVVVELRASQPIMPLRLFADRTRASAYLNMLLVPATMFAVFYFLTQFVQEVTGFSPVRAGFAFLPLTLMIFSTTRLVPRLLLRFGPKPVLVTGSALITAGVAWLTQISASTEYVFGLLGPMLLLGVGVGLVFMPLTLVILSGTQRQDAGAASGLLQTMQQIGGSLGIAILVTVFGTASRNAADDPLPNLSPESRAHQIMADAMASSFTVAVVIAAAALLVAFIAIRNKASSPSA